MTTLLLIFGGLAAACLLAFIWAAVRLEREAIERERELDAFRAQAKGQADGQR